MKEHCLLSACFGNEIPVTSHVAIGTVIIHCHPSSTLS